MATIQEVYIALFGRPADPIGYNYYVEATDDGANLDAVGDLSASPEYLDRFDGMSNIQKVNAIYQDLFGRPADAAGLTFYVGLLNSGAATEQSIAIQILDGATGDDATIIENKVAAAQLFTDSLDTGDEIADYDGAEAAAAGRAYLDGVGLDEDSIPTQEEVDAAIAALDGLGNVGDDFTLTDDAGEVVDGTTADDTFNAIIDGATPANSTLNNFDQLDGGDGNDTLNLLVDGAVAVPASASIENIETVNIDRVNAAGTVDASVFVGAAAIWQISEASAIANVGAETTVGFRDVVAAGSTATPVETNDTLSAQFDGGVGAVALDGVEFEAASGAGTLSGNLEVSGDADADLESLTISGSVEEDTLAVDAGADAAVSSLTLSMTSDAVLSGSIIGGDLVDFDASGSTGGITADLSDAVALETALGGEDGDAITVDLTARTSETLDVAGGGDNDIITVEQSGLASADNVTVTLSGDAGNDTFDFVLAADLENIADADEADFEAGIITIADFNADEDVLDISDLAAPTTLSNTQLSDLAAEDSLYDALQAAADIGTDATFVFDYDGDVYVYANNGTDNDFDAGDGLIRLTGTSIEDFDSANYFTA